MSSMATFTVPTVSNAPIDMDGLLDKVSIRNLDFFYGDHRALKNINVSLYQGKVTAFIGPSGCGKSTLLRILNRMYDLSTSARPAKCGSIRQYFVAVAGPQSAGAGRHGVPEADAVSDDRSSRTSPSASVHRRRAAGIRARRPVQHALQRAALWEEVKDKLGTNGLSLSGGQQQRLCIARAIAVGPR